MRFNKKVAAVAASTTLGVALGAGVGLAYWSTTGSGSDTHATSTGNAAAVSVATKSTLTSFYPGDSAQALQATVTNNDTAQKVYVSHVYAYLTVAKLQSAGVDVYPGSCTSADYLLDGVSGTTSSSKVTMDWTAQELAASGSADTNLKSVSAPVHAGDSIQFNNTGSNQDGCKGATVTIHYVTD